jgi:antitoxin CcdA
MAQKTRTNVSVDADLLAEARTLGLNVSAALEVGLRAILAETRRQRWLEENRGALADANTFVAERGLWSDGKRQF